MNFVRAETIVQEITDDGKVRDIITQVKKSEAEQEAERREHVLRSLPEFKRDGQSAGEQKASEQANEQQEKDDAAKEYNVHTIDEAEFEPRYLVSKTFLFSTPYLGKMNPFWLIIFKLGWFKHQLPRNIINRLKMRSERRRESWDPKMLKPSLPLQMSARRWRKMWKRNRTVWSQWWSKKIWTSLLGKPFRVCKSA